MGRGKHNNTMSEEQLKEAKARRDKAYYERHRKDKQRAFQLAKMNAPTITCGCGGTYKDVPQLKCSHLRTQRHSLYDEEERLQIRQLICKKVKGVNTLAEAQTKLDEIYFNKERYNYSQKEGYLPTLVKRLNKIEDKPPPPPPPPKKVKKLVIKKKINVINNE